MLNDNSKSSITQVIANSEARAKSLHNIKNDLTKEDDKAKQMSSRNSARDKKQKSSLFKEKKKKKEKVVITGDDILIEYVRRLKNSVLKQK